MNPYHGRACARPEEPITSVILRGDAWTARRIPSNCLRQHCHALATTFRRREFDSLRARCARVFLVVETRSRILTEIHPMELAVVAAVARLGAYSAHWLRQPEDWRPDETADGRSQWADLLRHLLARYAVPSLLDAAWTIEGSLEHFDRDCWCALAQGQSLRAVPGFPRSVPHRVLHAALASATDPQRCRNLALLIWRAQLRALNASPALEAAVLASRVPRELGNYGLWSRLVAKFSGSSDVQDGDFEFVANSLAAALAHRGVAQVEQLMKLPLRVLARHCHRFAADLFKAQGYSLTEAQVREAAAKRDFSKVVWLRWQPLLSSVPFVSERRHVGERSRWIVEELCSVAALEEEGRAMKHCVGRYAGRCREGGAAVFSVRHFDVNENGQAETTSYATVEVQRTTRKVVQIRACRNRPANNTVMAIVRDWATENSLVCAM